MDPSPLTEGVDFFFGRSMFTHTRVCVCKHTHMHGSQVWQGGHGARQRRRQENGSEVFGAGGGVREIDGKGTRREHEGNTKFSIHDVFDRTLYAHVGAPSKGALVDGGGGGKVQEGKFICIQLY